MTRYVVKAGDCFASIAARAGLGSGKTLYYAQSQEFRRRRPNPDLIFPGDVLELPDPASRQADCATNRRHRFRRKGTPIWLRLRLQDALGNAMSRCKYLLDLGDCKWKGTTDSDGKIEKQIPAHNESGVLVVYQRDSSDEYARWNLMLGHLDPLEEIRGVQQRLNNLGFQAGPPDGAVGPRTSDAVRAFQEDRGMETNGKLDDSLRAELKSAYGC